MLLAEELKIKTLLQKASKYTSFYNPTLLFTSTSVCTVYHKLLINKLLVFAMVLLVVMVLLLLLSLNNDVKKAREIKNVSMTVFKVINPLQNNMYYNMYGRNLL